MLPVLECADVTDKEGGRHYWVFNVNLRDERFEVLDSNRTLDNIELMNTASTIAGGSMPAMEEALAKVQHRALPDY